MLCRCCKPLLHLILFAGIFFVVFFETKMPCPISLLFDVSCPTCKMTRAVTSLLHGDVNGYIENNAMALPVGAAVWTQIHMSFFRKKRTVQIAVTVILLLNTLYWICRI